MHDASLPNNTAMMKHVCCNAALFPRLSKAQLPVADAKTGLIVDGKDMERSTPHQQPKVLIFGANTA